MNCKAVDPNVDDNEATMEKADDAAHESVEGNAFDIEDIIDVNNLDLHDTLSDKPISKPKLLLKDKQPTSVIAAAKELVESDWVLWHSLLPIYMVLWYPINCISST